MRDLTSSYIMVYFCRIIGKWQEFYKLHCETLTDLRYSDNLDLKYLKITIIYIILLVERKRERKRKYGKSQ